MTTVVAKAEMLEWITRLNQEAHEDKQTLRKGLESDVQAFLSNGGSIRQVTGSVLDFTCKASTDGKGSVYRDAKTVEYLQAQLRKDDYHRGRAALKRKRAIEASRRAKIAERAGKLT